MKRGGGTKRQRRVSPPREGRASRGGRVEDIGPYLDEVLQSASLVGAGVLNAVVERWKCADAALYRCHAERRAVEGQAVRLLNQLAEPGACAGPSNLNCLLAEPDACAGEAVAAVSDRVAAALDDALRGLARRSAGARALATAVGDEAARSLASAMYEVECLSRRLLDVQLAAAAGEVEASGLRARLAEATQQRQAYVAEVGGLLGVLRALATRVGSGRWQQQAENQEFVNIKKEEEEEGVTEQLRRALVQAQSGVAVAQKRLLEEQHWRERAEGRIAEMLRQPHCGGPSGAVAELGRLRSSLTEALDDAAQLTVSLKLAREELAGTNTELDALRTKNEQLLKAVHADQVGRAVTELKRVYDETTQSLRERFVEAESQRGILSSALDKSRETVKELQEASAQAKANYKELDFLEKKNRDRHHDFSNARSKILEFMKSIGKLLKDENAVMEGKVGELTLINSQITSKQAESLGHFQKQIHDLFQGFQEVLSDDKASTSAEAEDDNRKCHDEALKEKSLNFCFGEEKYGLLLQVLQSALQFVGSHLENGDTQRAGLLEASLADAALVNDLRSRLHQITQDRDRLSRKLTKCLNIIDQNSLTVVENALLYEVPVEDSLSAAEAAEHIALLREQLDVAVRTQKWGVKDIEDWKKAKESLEAEVREVRYARDIAEKQLLQTDQTLLQSLEREKEMLVQNMALQSQITTLVSSSFLRSGPSETGDNSASAELSMECAPNFTPSPPFAQLLQQVSAQFASIEKSIADLNAQRKQREEELKDPLETVSLSCPSAEEITEIIAQGGMNVMVELLRKAMMGVQELRESICRFSLQHKSELSAIIHPDVQSPEAALLAEKERCDAFEKELNALKEEKEVIRQRLQVAEEGMAKSEETNHRILSISKTLMERQNRLLEENKQLKSKCAPPSPATSEVPQVSAVSVEDLTIFITEAPPPTEQPLEGEREEASIRDETMSISISHCEDVNEELPSLPLPPC
ncbi:unnamed protein product [Phytomonas sp. Hart1]|nr:unnamed protein product [Phytomonas sp. Hart1]|eukprot:CCW70852.1 unnamed protein product [Phytomonas sp. isolate Hart1]